MPDVSCERVEKPARIEAQRAPSFNGGSGGRRVKAPGSSGEERSSVVTVLTVLSSAPFYTRENPSVKEKEALEKPFSCS